MSNVANQTGPFVLPNLPYPQNALEPHITANQLAFHHGKHHNAYVTNLNSLVKGTEYEQVELEKIIKESYGDPAKIGLFNNAAQIWNHTFFWHSMKPNGGGKPGVRLLAQIEKDFGGYEKLVSELKNAGVGQFGSGWAWLVWDNDKLRITKTANADLPLVHGQTALLAIDVWEHAYYLDYQNRRGDYLNIFMDHLVNWEFAEANFQGRRA